MRNILSTGKLLFIAFSLLVLATPLKAIPWAPDVWQETNQNRAIFNFNKLFTENSVFSASFLEPQEDCLNTSAYMTIAAPTSQIIVIVTTCDYAGDYSTITDAVAGTDYTFYSSTATDYLTIRQGTYNGPVIGQGVQPVVASVTESGKIFVHVNTDSDCGVEDFCRTISINCSSCAPETDYCAVTSTNTAYGIANFSTTGGEENINNASDAGTYTDYSDQYVSKKADELIDFTIVPVQGTNGYAIWVDWNNNFIFDADERMYNAGDYLEEGIGSFKAPAGTAPGDYRMRVVSNWLASTPQACGNLGGAAYGEAEDYTFRVLETETPSNEDCDQGDDSNGFENGLQVGAGTDFRNADDFFVSAGNTLHIVQIELNAIYMYDSVGSVDLIFYKDEGGVPGAVEQTVSGLIPSAQPAIGTAFGYSVKTLFIDVDLSFTEGHYWMQPTLYDANGGTGGFFWEISSAGTLGQPIVTSELNGPWTYDDNGSSAVFKLHCEAVTPPEEPCLFAITSTVEPITRVILSDIDNPSDPNSSVQLEDFTSIEGHLAPGASYDVALEGNTAGPYTNYFSLWIDFDQNGSYESTEMFEIGSIVNSTGTDGQQATANITIPTGAAVGNTTMRVIKNYNSSPTNPCGQYSFGQGEDYTIIIAELEDCDGTPEPGTVSVNPEIGNAGSTYTVSSSGYSFGNGLTYQWQSNTNGAGWVDEGPLMDAYASFTATAPDEEGTEVEWRLSVSCTLSGESAESNVAMFTVEKVYCHPKGTNPDRYINDFTTSGGVENINNTNSGYSTDGYGDFFDTMGVSQVINQPVSFNANFVGGTFGFRIWVDWNQNGTFEQDEVAFASSNGYQASYGGTFEVPATALLGETRMRIGNHWLDSTGPQDPCMTFTYGEFEDYKFTVLPMEDCGGTPDGGTVSVNPELGNPGSNYTVSATGYSVGNGLSYQWQSNTDGAGWVNEGAASDFYSAYTATAPLEVGTEVEWRLEVSCANSGETAYSDTDTFTTGIVFCEPSFSYVEPITRVVFADIDNSSSPDSAEGYEDFTSVVGNVTLTETYDIALEGYTGGNWTNYFTVWVDWNQNGTFEDTEMYQIGSITASTGTDGQQATGTISVPDTALIGETRMRVIKNFNSSPTDPCGSYSFGQAEDYTLNVESLGVNDMGLADFAYWPNPVKDVLNISSAKAVQSVDIFNLAGQNVKKNVKVTDGKVDVSNLSQGTYVFRIKFDGNKTKSFKIIKR